jgi:radical SAM superfamily enzyme YgiQ (UPF0313 family)
MRMALISPYTSITMCSVRQLSACMKVAGHQVNLIFLPAYPKADARIRLKAEPYTPECMSSLAELCSDCDLVGISLMTDFHSAALQITRSLRGRVKAPVIWGGVHPSFTPEECLRHADMVCVGEGEEALVELADYLAVAAT